MIFLSYVTEDRARVMPYYELLDAHGLRPWMDCRSIQGGQNWQYEISTALERAQIIVVFVSSNSVDKRGYAQREIAFAIDKVNEKLKEDIFIIPIMLDRVEFPFLLKSIHFIDAVESSEAEVGQKLIDSINTSLRRASETVSEVQATSDVRWNVDDVKTEYSGIPGYSTSVQRISLYSSKYSNLYEIADHINGNLSEHSMQARRAALRPDPLHYNLMQDEWSRTDTFDAIFTSVNVKGRLISIDYTLHWYSAGAAHPVHAPKSFCYLLDPLIHLINFSEVFRGDGALSGVQKAAESAISQALYGDDIDQVNADWIREGTKDWDCFKCFSFVEDGIVVSFPSYQVACYAAGIPQALIPYSNILEHLSDVVLHALGLYRPRN